MLKSELLKLLTSIPGDPPVLFAQARWYQPVEQCVHVEAAFDGENYWQKGVTINQDEIIPSRVILLGPTAMEVK
jgi:hypothetical protein